MAADRGLHLAEHAARIETDAHAFARAAARRRSTAWCAYRRRRCSPATSSRRGSPARSAQPALRIDLLGEMHAANLTHAKPISRCGCRGRPSRPPRAGSARCASRCARRRNGRTRRPTWPFVGYDDALAQTPQHQWLARFAAGRRSRSSPAAQHRACAAGAGVALLPRFLVDEPAAHAGAPLVELTAAPRCDIEREIWLVVHPDVRRSPRVQRVADAIAEAVHAADGRL